MKRFFCAFAFAALLVSSFAFTNVRAADDITPVKFDPQVTVPGAIQGEVNVGTYDPGSGKMTSDLLSRYIKGFYDYGLMIAGIAAAIMLMAGGVLWLVSGGDSGKVAQAKEYIFGSITGIIILVCAWIILNTINPDLIKMRPIVTDVIKKVSFCCDASLGNVPMNSKGECDKGQPCQYPKTCIQMSTSSDSFACKKPNLVADEDGNVTKATGEKDTSTFCCQMKADNTDGRYCLNVQTGSSCPSKQGGYSYEISHASVCAVAGKIGGDSCLYNECLEADWSDDCGPSDNGDCYYGQCLFNDGTKIGDPCGNDEGSSCAPKDKCDDRDTGGGRNCGETSGGINLVCCIKGKSKP